MLPPRAQALLFIVAALLLHVGTLHAKDSRMRKVHRTIERRVPIDPFPIREWTVPQCRLEWAATDLQSVCRRTNDRSVHLARVQ